MISVPPRIATGSVEGVGPVDTRVLVLIIRPGAMHMIRSWSSRGSRGGVGPCEGPEKAGQAGAGSVLAFVEHNVVLAMDENVVESNGWRTLKRDTRAGWEGAGSFFRGDRVWWILLRESSQTRLVCGML